MTKAAITTQKEVLDLDLLPDDLAVTYKIRGTAVWMNMKVLRAVLVGKPGQGNHTPRGDKEKQSSGAGAAMKALRNALTKGDVEKISKFTARCEKLMGAEWTQQKVQEHTKTLTNTARSSRTIPKTRKAG